MPADPDPEAFEDGKEQAAKGLLNVANILSETIDAMPEDMNAIDQAFRCYLWDTMELCRSIADKIDPPVEDWPDKVVPIIRGKRKR